MYGWVYVWVGGWLDEAAGYGHFAVIIISDGSCIAKIFPSRKLNALAHIIHANIHTDINIIHPSPPDTHTHHGPPRLVEMPAEKGKF